ncbi:glycosyltransferase family 2 protein [Flavobacterium acetivorans]|uniref:glycosyltransferase family 2 protein n=1 Tax=Flavobacterium acetivorans TaxID=2893883 RepID=UPI001E3A7714|nr:glycosyltransferase [Flavobacterium sp. F-29]UFH35710.1 glycosyltransferase family 2 protein [Flavobacterium sp. F-29]
MEVSILIVTKNRPDELEITLNKLSVLLDLSIQEVLVFVDGCKKTEVLIEKYPWVKWEISEISISASPARNELYKKAKGVFFIGLDDDSHPLNEDFITKIKSIFLSDTRIGIIAFQEIRGVFVSDKESLEKAEAEIENYKTNDFVGCGFAIRKEIYEKTNGFPVWIDIYGEESCLSIEVLDLGYEIYYDNTIIVNHRVNKKKRLTQGRNYFRFEKQLKNTIFYYVVYFPNPILKIIRLLFHNFKKYALHDFKYFQLFWKSIFNTCKEIFHVLKYRKPVQKSTLRKLKTIKGIKY